MKSYVIAFEPEENLKKIISKIKSMCFDLVGDQLYLMDPPHITLFVGYLQEGFIEEVKNVKFVNLFFEFKNWKAFEDKITFKQTYSSFSENNKEFRREQLKLIKSLKSYIPKKRLKRYELAYDNLSKNQKHNFDIYGYPFIGEEADAHISIASFNKKDFNKICGFLKKESPKGNYSIENLIIYELTKKEKLNILNKIDLK